MLFTIGYEGATQGAVLDALRRNKIALLVDVRAVAASRKPGFYKRQVAPARDEHGIAYLHLQKLGTPAEGRQAARKGDADTMLRIYEKHLKTHDAREAMDELVALAASGRRICLLCFERDANHCHRRRIAEIVRQRTGVSVRNLEPEQP